MTYGVSLILIEKIDTLYFAHFSQLLFRWLWESSTKSHLVINENYNILVQYYVIDLTQMSFTIYVHTSFGLKHGMLVYKKCVFSLIPFNPV